VSISCCQIIDCERESHTRGYCKKHYELYRQSKDYVPIHKHRLSDIDIVSLRAICSECGLTDIYSNSTKNKSGGLQFRCKSHVNQNRFARYGITYEDYNDLVKLQGNLCAICGEPETARAWNDKSKSKTLHVDHDHETGQVRGLLCQKCNTGLGGLKDDIKLLKLAIEYLEKWQSL
jgi:hypothetical protein